MEFNIDKTNWLGYWEYCDPTAKENESVWTLTHV
jgi:hypothetical protein